MSRWALALIFLPATAWADAGSFGFHLLGEAQTLDPQTTSAASGNYLFHNIYRGLYRYDGKRGLVLEGAESCAREKLKLICRLRDEKWSDGKPVTAGQYLENFRRLIDPDKRSPQSDVLFTIKNAREIWAGRMSPDSLGVSAKDARTLEFEFSEEDPEFEYKLIHPALSPHPPSGYLARENSPRMVVNGPYVIKEWKVGARVRLKPNPHYSRGNSKRPPLEAYFIDEDATALRLYESGKMQFLRRVAASEIPRHRGKPDFHQVPMGRFDYIGFGPDIAGNAKLREALTASVEFKNFLKLFDTRSAPGCPSLPLRLSGRVECMKFDKSRAARALKESGFNGKLEMGFSRMGGDDIARGAEWFQGQWKRHLGLTVELQSEEQAVYLRQLKVKPPAIFRKGVSLDRPTCLAGLEVFTKGNPENYIRFEDAKYEELVNELRRAKGEGKRRIACRKAVEHLLFTRRLIPLGEMYFTILVDPLYTGWDLNELNQLDLSRLQRKL